MEGLVRVGYERLCWWWAVSRVRRAERMGLGTRGCLLWSGKLFCAPGNFRQGFGHGGELSGWLGLHDRCPTLAQERRTQNRELRHSGDSIRVRFIGGRSILVLFRTLEGSLCHRRDTWAVRLGFRVPLHSPIREYGTRYIALHRYQRTVLVTPHKSRDTSCTPARSGVPLPRQIA